MTEAGTGTLALQERSKRRKELVARLVELLDRFRDHSGDQAEALNEMDVIVTELRVLNDSTWQTASYTLLAQRCRPSTMLQNPGLRWQASPAVDAPARDRGCLFLGGQIRHWDAGADTFLGACSHSPRWTTRIQDVDFVGSLPIEQSGTSA